MEDFAKLALKKICCTCLSIDRKLSQLCKLKDGVNNLFFLMSVDSVAYEAMLRSDVTRFYICWECNAFMRRQRRFIDQVRVAQKHLSQIVDAEIDIKPQNSLSKLISVYHNKYDKEFVYHNSAIDNFIDCGPDVNTNDDEIKSELNIDLVGTDYELASLSEGDSTTDNLDNIKVLENKFEIQPLSINKRKSTSAINERDQVNDDLVDEEELNKEEVIISSELEEITVLQSEKETKSCENNCKSKNEINKATPKTSNVLKKNIGRNKSKVKREEDFIKEDGFSRIKMTEEELVESIESRKLENDYVLALNKCESCVEVFNDQIELEEHNTRLHSQKPKFIQCDICQVYIKFWWLSEHKSEHYLKYQCSLCSQVYYTVLDMLLHLKNIHDMKNILTPFMLRKLKRRAVQTKPVLAPKTSSAADDAESAGADAASYRCPECNKNFDNRYQRYKHIIKMHREGHRCGACGKTFAFRNTLNKHVLIHATPHPMEQCPTCGKMVRCDGAAAHARTHAARGTFQCVACDKRFTSRDSYQKHLKYSSRHAVTDVRKYKCTMCEKGFRTLRELNDHVNYNHMGKTQHKCPICHKALATQRCVKRHVSRAHHGIKEKSGDKILCQTCGKAFRDKKCLREHELIHTGEKPLSCELCARTFRQSACLYTHKRRVHKMAPKRLHVQHTGADSGVDSNVQHNKEINDINSIN